MPQLTFAGLKRRFSRDGWNVGVLQQPIEDVVRRGITEPVRWLPDRGPGLMLADPAFLLERDGTCVVFAEHLDHWTGRGEIWAARVSCESDLAEAMLHPWMGSRVHLSYPRPIVAPDGSMFFMAESWEAGALHLWRREGDSLNHHGAIIQEPVLDPTPWHDGATWWLFCTFYHKAPNAHLRLFYADRLEGPWTSHPCNPVKTDPASCRPAGPIFVVDGYPIRPAQDCSETYGGAISFNRILRLDKSGFDEVAIGRLRPGLTYPHGLHTICPAGDLTLIDGKRDSFRTSDIPRKLAVSLVGRLRPLVRSSLPARLPLPA